MGLYHSTRSRETTCTAKQAIRTGIAADGGLFVSDALGETAIDIATLADKGYHELAREVLGILLPDYTADEIAACVDEAYGATFASDEVTPLVPLACAPDGTADAPTFVLELFGGPTSAFKDVALQMLPRLMARTGSADAQDERIMIVTATSGDTGKAALAGFADAPGCGITVFYPEGKVSRVQELQMSTQEGANVAVCGVRGNFDDAQTAVKRIFADRDLAARLDQQGVMLSSANSINVGRLVPQVVYYFAAYAQLLRAGAARLLARHIPFRFFWRRNSGIGPPLCGCIHLPELCACAMAHEAILYAKHRGRFFKAERFNPIVDLSQFPPGKHTRACYFLQCGYK